MAYNFKKIESKWQSSWEKNKINKAKDFDKRPKYYCLVEFPYPSGDGLHVGHTRSYTAMDVIARKRRMENYNVIYPMGWDAFGLPTENYAIKKGVHPKIVTKKNTDIFRRQLKSLGFSFDWDREINTTDPKYYKWTQWIFLQLFKKGLAYKKKIPINWCLSCKTGLANEEVVDGKCERCGGATEKREKEQWVLAITKYADRLDKDLDTVEYLEKIKIQQRNWIGKSEGTLIKFEVVAEKGSSPSSIPVASGKDSRRRLPVSALEVFTTRVDTIFGCTYVVVAPEHEIISNLKSQISNLSDVEKYIKEAKNKSDLQRTELQKEKTGVELKGVKAVNPFNNEEVPVFVADYVLGHYGTGAVMAVPAHDERDFEFAKKYGLEIKEVVIQPDTRSGNVLSSIPVASGKDSRKQISTSCYTDDGLLVDSGQFSNMTSEKAREEMTKWLEKNKLGKGQINYKLRDWIFSRQHYWGEPIPMIICDKCGEVPVLEKDLPVELPNVKKYEPTDTGESPLANMTKWVNVKCPKCKGSAKRETDTMPNWAGSSWYFLRYMDPKNNKVLADKKKLKYWAPIDWYNGGMEHTTLHLLYSRFWNKFLYDIKVAPSSEPYKKRTSHGMILGEDGEKMSKSRGNVVNPDDIVKNFGADAFRLYQLFMGPFDQAIPWDSQGITGTKRFLERVWKLQEKTRNGNMPSSIPVTSGKDYRRHIPVSLETLFHKTIKKVSEDIEEMRFNTAVSSLMILLNEMEKDNQPSVISYQLFIKLLSPFAPHIAEEIWHKMDNKKSIFNEKWPKFDAKKIKEDTFNLIVQVNGKVRDVFEVQMGIIESDAKALTLKRENVKKYISNKTPKKVIFVQDKLINIVI